MSRAFETRGGTPAPSSEPRRAAIDPFIGIVIAIAAAASAGLACSTARGWRAVVVFGTFLPVLGVWSALLLIGLFVLLVSIGLLPPQ